MLNSHLFAMKQSHHISEGQIVIQDHDVESKMTSSVGSDLQLLAN